MRSRLWWFGLFSICLLGCNPPKSGTGKSNGIEPEVTKKEIGPALYERAEYTPFSGDSAGDFILVPAGHLTAPYRHEISSQIDAIIDWIGVEIPEEQAKKYDPRDIFQHEASQKFYRRLQQGDVVKRDQIVVLLDDKQAKFDYLTAKARLEAAEKSEDALKKVVKALSDLAENLKRGAGAIPLQEVTRAEAEVQRYEAELVKEKGQVITGKAELDKAEDKLSQYVLRSALSGEVVSIHRNQRESLRSTDVVLVVQDFSRLRVEGSLKVEYLNRVRIGDEVSMEVTRYQSAREIDTFAQHTPNRAITAIALTEVGGQVLIVSAGEDGWVRVWNREQKVLQSWKMPSAVRTLAVAQKEPLLLLPSDSGDLHLYDLANLAKEPLRKLDPKAEGVVTAVALSPDGNWATVADERGIHLYQTRTGKKHYTLPSKAHHSQITQLTLTPQGRLISVGKEPSILVWELGEKGAFLEHRFDSRTGDVLFPAVSEDGNRLYIDTDKNRLDVIHLGEARRERSLNLGTEGGRFHNFTVLSPQYPQLKDRLLLSAGGTEGIVHLFRAPSAQARGSELIRYVTKGYAPATAAAFSPPLKDKPAFFVVGTKKGDIHIWPVPEEAELNNEFKSRLSYLDKTIDSSGRTVRISIDLENPKLPNGDYLFRPGSSTNLILKAR
ncbi:MAG: HlyD family efflux transporter periplasmic adaptor subunit [Gemmataceae bacterium]|nr:HlyD family efflux transporter periplasmic adaptor subunit [Gemmataceae bacterium]